MPATTTKEHTVDDIRTRQMIEAEAASPANADFPGILKHLREEWKTAPVGKCSLKGHEDRDAVEAVRLFDGWQHNCAECKPRWEESTRRAARNARERSSRAAAAGARAQTQHRQ